MEASDFSLDEAIDHLLVYMSSATFTIAEAWHKWHRLPPSYFNRAEPFVLLDALGPLRSDEQGYLLDVAPSDLTHPLNIAMVATVDEDNPLSESFALVRYKQVKPSEVRGKTTQHLPTMLEAATAIVDIKRGVARTSRVIFGRTASWVNISAEMTKGMHGDGRKWVQEMQGINSGVTAENIDMAYSMAFTRRYQWLITLAFDGSPSILLPTDPVGVREVVRLRDIPEGRQRRAALKHWVKNHYRKGRNDPTALTYVRQHLRGREHFTWNGLHCTIEPSEFDWETNEQLRQDRVGNIE